MAVIGIDFGTTTSEVAVVNEFGAAQAIPNCEGEELTPSVVAFEDDGTPIIGRQAAHEALARPSSTVRHFKMSLGSGDVLYKDPQGNPYTATDCAALFLARLGRDAETALGDSVTGAVISVPANYDDRQKHETLEAARKAGLEVLKLVHEPTAAATAYGLKKGQDQTFLVTDLGGGTYDASLVRCQGDEIHILGTDGIADLGGRKYTEAIKEYALAEFTNATGHKPNPKKDFAFFQDLHDRAEQAKCSLSVVQTAKLVLSAGGQYHTVELTREKFDEMIAPWSQQMVDKCTELLDSNDLSWDQLDAVLLVGGGNKVPAVQQAIEAAFGKPLSRDIDPVKAVSYGAAIQATIEAAANGGQATLQGRAIPAPKIEVKEVTTHAIGCAVDDPNRGEVQAVIIPRNSPVPCEHRDLFRLKHADQNGAHVQILQGEEGQLADQCLTVGELLLDDLPPDAALPQRIQVTYRIDKNGMCVAFAEDLPSGKKSELQFDYSGSVSRAAAV